jgi:hypothetical protein
MSFADSEVPEVPDYTSPIAGARSWRVANTLRARLRGTLWSDAIIDAWPDGEEVEATCEKLSHVKAGGPWVTPYQILIHENHQPPEWDCSCGLYAFYDIERLMETAYYAHGDFRQANGIVSARGQIILHEDGFRAQFMKVEAILADEVPDEELPIPKAEIAERCGVPLVDPRKFHTFCEERGLLVLTGDE